MDDRSWKIKVSPEGSFWLQEKRSISKSPGPMKGLVLAAYQVVYSSESVARLARVDRGGGLPGEILTEILTETEASQGWFDVGPVAVAMLQQPAAAVPVEYHRQWGGLYVVALIITDGG